METKVHTHPPATLSPKGRVPDSFTTYNEGKPQDRPQHWRKLEPLPLPRIEARFPGRATCSRNIVLRNDTYRTNHVSLIIVANTVDFLYGHRCMSVTPNS